MQPILLPSIAFPSPYCGQKCVHLLGKEVGTHLSGDVPFPMPIYPVEVYRARNVIFTVARYHPLSRAILTLPSPRPAFPFRRTILRIPGGYAVSRTTIQPPFVHRRSSQPTTTIVLSLSDGCGLLENRRYSASRC